MEVEYSRLFKLNNDGSIRRSSGRSPPIEINIAARWSQFKLRQTMSCFVAVSLPQPKNSKLCGHERHEATRACYFTPGPSVKCSSLLVNSADVTESKLRSHFLRGCVWNSARQHIHHSQACTIIIIYAAQREDKEIWFHRLHQLYMEQPTKTSICKRN